jgi:ribosomal-protein-alanine N-acetyltransferase
MPAKIEIGPARVADAQVIADMSRRLVEIGLPWSWTPARVARHLSHPDSLVITARADGELAGFGIMHFGEEVAHLNLLAVDTAYQRLGVGQQLLAWLERSAVTAGIFLVCLEVRARNPVAIRFYRHLGYQEAGRLPKYYSGREDAVRMTRDLRDPESRRAALLPPPATGNATAGGSTLAGADWILTKFRR